MGLAAYCYMWWMLQRSAGFPKEQQVKPKIISKLCNIICYRFAMKHVDYDSLVPPAGYGAIMTRNASSSQCQCSVCQVGCLYGVNYISYKEKVSEPVGQPQVHPPTEPESI